MEEKSYLDTTLEGPVFYKAGVSYAFKISETWSFKTAFDFTHLIALDACPPTQAAMATDTAATGSSIKTNCDSPSIHFDMNLGIAASF